MITVPHEVGGAVLQTGPWTSTLAPPPHRPATDALANLISFDPHVRFLFGLRTEKVTSSDSPHLMASGQESQDRAT